jgi:diguanylate cyclase (GGDEF)-like protein
MAWRPRPDDSSPGRAAAWTLRAVAIAALVALSVRIADGAVGPDVPGTAWLGSDTLHAGLEVLAALLCLSRAQLGRHDRVAWLLVGTGIGAYTVGDTIWYAVYGNSLPPFPSIADAFWISFYLLVIAGTAMLVRGHVRLRQRTLWLDGAVGGLVLAAVGLPAIMAGGLGFAGSSMQAAAVNFTYPVLDLSLLAALVAVFALTGWRLGPMWIVYGGGLVLLSVADIMFLTEPTMAAVDLRLRPIHTLSLLLIGLASWQRTEDVADVDMRSVRVMLLPSALALVAAGVLGYAAVRHVPILAVTLALAALAGVVCRTWLTIREIQTLSNAHAAALRDELTGLGNRRSLYEEVERRIREGGSRPLAVLLLDLDSFRDLNDVLGHEMGDTLLIEVARRVNETTREGDRIVRMGGDEFAVLLDAPAEAGAARAAAARILAALDRSFVLDGMRLHISASIGAALHPEHGEDAQTLLRHADIAMYDAKAHGNTYRVYRGEAEDAHTRDRLVLVEELRHAVGNGEIEVHYQPKASFATGEISGVEALVRWRHPTRGLLAPAAFLSAAERTGMFRTMTRFILDQALADCSRWLASGHDLSVAVNLSTIDLLDPDLACEVAERLAAHGVPPRNLRFEVTEEVVMSDPDRAQAVLESLSDAGVAIALDDFGTGYSSLARLARLPVSELKIDRSFVACMTTDPGRAAIVRSTIHLAHDLGLNVVAEGIEYEEQWDSLAALGCDEAQGYLLARPAPAHELEELLDRGNRRAA